MPLRASLRQQKNWFRGVTRGRPLSQGVPSSKTVHRTVFKFTPCGGILTLKCFRSLRRATKGSAFGNRKLLKKLEQNFCVVAFRNNYKPRAANFEPVFLPPRTAFSGLLGGLFRKSPPSRRSGRDSLSTSDKHKCRSSRRLPDSLLRKH